MTDWNPSRNAVHITLICFLAMAVGCWGLKGKVLRVKLKGLKG